MKAITLTKTNRDIEYLYSKNDSYKGKATERLVREILYLLGADLIEPITNIEQQLFMGDLIFFKDNNKSNIEVKSSHSFNRTDKLAIDIAYFNYDTKRNKIIPYIQSNNDLSMGWLFPTFADTLIAYNSDSNTMYILKDFQKLREKLIEDTNLYVKELPSQWLSWYKNNHNNKINRYLEGAVKKDRNKETFIINLELSEESFRYYNIDYDIIKVEFNKVMRNLDIDIKKRPRDIIQREL